ncbi:MAG TPA: hypothetical protein VGO65_04305 [Pseudolysinimonas sp.]|nr:hypothetical protein [Pseudolysinimonas sp.]
MAHPEDLEDEDAFHWAGDEVGGREGARLPSQQIQDDGAGPGEDVASPVPIARSHPATTIVTALFAVLYLAITVGWILGTGYTTAGSVQLLPQLLWQFGEFTAIVAGPLWFAGTVLMTRGGRLLTRAGWLALGLGVLLPWPVLPLLVVS